MEMKDSIVIAAPRAEVWAHLNSADTLRVSVPGCESLEGAPEEGFAATVKAKVGPVRATFKGAVELSEVIAPDSYVITGEGKGGVAGFANGTARVALSDHDEGTQLDYEVVAKIGGKLAQLGSRLIGGFARKMADQFFENFKAEVEAGEQAEDAGA